MKRTFCTHHCMQLQTSQSMSSSTAPWGETLGASGVSEFVRSSERIKGHAKDEDSYHAWSTADGLRECWHYLVESDVAERLVAEGRAVRMVEYLDCEVGAEEGGPPCLLGRP
jgi:hypothetical protein